MAREPIHRRLHPSEYSLSSSGPKTSGTYAVLAPLSRRYPPPKGKLLTCYSPVRRFTRHPKVPFSLDLHVLSAPLAFVLSQDQTLQFITEKINPSTLLFSFQRANSQFARRDVTQSALPCQEVFSGSHYFIKVRSNFDSHRDDLPKTFKFRSGSVFPSRAFKERVRRRDGL